MKFIFYIILAPIIISFLLVVSPILLDLLDWVNSVIFDGLGSYISVFNDIFVAIVGENGAAFIYAYILIWVVWLFLR